MHGVLGQTYNDMLGSQLHNATSKVRGTAGHGEPLQELAAIACSSTAH